MNLKRPTYIALLRLGAALSLILALFISSSKANAQADEPEKTVTLIGENITLKSAFKSIRQQTGFRFLYDDNILDPKSRRSPNFRQQPLSKVMAFLLEGTSVIWKLSGNTILLRQEKTSSTASPTGDVTEPMVMPTVSGKVKDGAGEGIAGATVQVKGTTKGATTDVNGSFTLSDITLGSVLVISTLGYETREVEIKAPTIYIGLNLDIRKLDETVIIGYGTTTKRFNTGSVVTIKAADISTQPVTNPLQALQGRVPGMTITQQTGVPGGGFNVQIRGQNSLRPEGNYPLYVVDGVPYSSTLLPSIGGAILGSNPDGTIGNPLNFINPSDIESIDILKDADATAIYGSRGANGVVLITTKKGKAGKTTIDVNFQKGIGAVSRKMKLLNTPEYLAMRHEAFKNDGATPDDFSAPDLLLWDTTRYTDWQDKLIGGTAQYTSVQGNVSGGSELVQYLIGGRYHRETTVFPGDFSDTKASVHFNISGTTTNRKFKSMLSGNYLADRNNLLNSDLTSTINIAPNAPEIYNADGTLNWANSTWVNPFVRLLRKYANKTNNLISNAVLSYEFVPGLEFKTSLGYNTIQVDEVSTSPIASRNPAFPNPTGSASFSDNTISSWIVEPQLRYEMSLNQGTLTALVGTTFQQNTSDGTIVNTSGVTDDALIESMKAASRITVESERKIRYKYNAVFGRINYNWKSKYLFNLTARRDGSSRFGPGKQFANFAAAGGAWIFSEEDFVKRAVPFMSFGKVRVSYGTAGNDQIADYGFMSLYNPGQYPYQGSPGLYPNNLFNADFAWEVNKKLESGLDLGFFKDRILLSLSYYRNRSSNQLVGYSLPPSTGFGSVTANLPAVVQNTGLELSLTTKNLQTKDFIWTTNLNLTIPKNKLIAYPGLEKSAYAGQYTIGEALTSQHVYHLLGVDPNTGEYQFADSKGNPVAYPDYTTDRTVMINTAPVYYGGIQNTLSYKGFQLDFLFQFVKQKGVNNLYNYLPGVFNVNQPIEVLGRWQNPEDIASIQRFNQDYNLDNAYQTARQSDQAISDASFIRLKNISLRYQFPEKVNQRLHLQHCSVFLQGQNVFTITNYPGLDPESQNVSSLPSLRVMTMGFQLTF